MFSSRSTRTFSRRDALAGVVAATFLPGAAPAVARGAPLPQRCEAPTDGGETACTDAGGPSVVFVDLGVTVSVELAASPDTRARGLGGHAPLDENGGMLFIFTAPGRYPFWMKGMTFALDMIWLAPSSDADGELVVVHVASDVPADPVGTPDSARPTYGPTVAATHVLEVNAGFAVAHGITVGSIAIVEGALNAV